MHIAITGSTGLIGSALVAAATAGGHTVKRLTRRAPQAADEAQWEPAKGLLEPSVLRGVDAVVNLAGEPIGRRRWSPTQKQRIRDSRVRGTGLLARTLAGMQDGPRVLVSSSGVNYYGDRGDDVLTEDEEPGDDFLADVCVAWEAAADPAREAGVRVVHLRTAPVLSGEGGVLRPQLPLFKAGLGARLGSGQQFFPWITLDDMVGIILHALASEHLAGPVNAVAPNPVRNAEFTDTLARVLSRPAFLAVPRFAPHLVLGEMADALLFASMRVVPDRAQEAGYIFRHPVLEEGLRDVLGRPAAS